MPDEKTKQKIERLSREEASKLREEAKRRTEEINKRIEETNRQIKEAREKRAKRQRDERNR